MHVPRADYRLSKLQVMAVRIGVAAVLGYTALANKATDMFKCLGRKVD